MTKLILKEIFRIFIGFINLFIFWGVKVKGDLYSVWGGVNTSGSIVSLIGIFQYAVENTVAIVGIIQCAHEDTGSMFSVIQCAGNDAWSGISAIQYAGNDDETETIGLIQIAGNHANAWITIYQWAGSQKSYRMSIT
ncbi:MAG: hypothetical protein A2675_00940 [Candidatus Yonathbacteria bacterium RIFCSPHIGHO2_01_FULL_51_10]|uniref:Uncharacterized protein n=1 Tax=Candidatus Yonathbacteria bacterium RIFCSPHIGHO2_01_FULL_51_10 TaxID=1802723 RepID=A0A1G2SA18_9BACT|nr:MAG: hypothetical protein A2675_00940 [Candidatus Yonathbacteria bacterium RIFCSPHIGHO2_01_FULL_51_10]